MRKTSREIPKVRENFPGDDSNAQECAKNLSFPDYDAGNRLCYKKIFSATWNQINPLLLTASISIYEKVFRLVPTPAIGLKKNGLL